MNEINKEIKQQRTGYQKFIVTLLAIFGGCSALIEMMTPFLLVFMWAKLFGFYGLGSYLMYGIALLAVVFRALKIGWLK